MMARVLASLAIVSALVVACGSTEDDSSFNNGASSGSSGSSGGSSGASGSGGFGSDSGSGQTPDDLIGAACATSTAGGQAEPVYLVFMVDRSGSMKFNPQPNNKWDSVVAGLTSFFKDTRSAGLFASEQVFPQGPDQCQSSSYQTPLVNVTALPDNAGTLAAALNANGPNQNFGTPTLPAVTGAVAFAQTLKAQGKKTAVVLVTDGDPQGCQSTVQNTATAAGSALPDIKTYVIGVGSSLTNLNSIAAGGGTTNAVLISTANPAQITTDFVNALGQIRQQALSCEFAIPPPPNGETLDINRVNVQFTPKGGAVQPLDYNTSCTGGKGWRYDNPSAPTKILVCPDSCNTLLANADGKVDIVFGCQTRGEPPR